MKELHGKTKLRRMFALFLSVMLLIVNIPVEAIGESIDGTDSSIIENMEDNPITENPTGEPDSDEDNSNIENPTGEPDNDKKDVNEEGEVGAFVPILDSPKFDFSKINANESLMRFLTKDVEVDMNDPVIQQVSKELDNLNIENPTEEPDGDEDNSDLISGNDFKTKEDRKMFYLPKEWRKFRLKVLERDNFQF